MSIFDGLRPREEAGSQLDRELAQLASSLMTKSDIELKTEIANPLATARLIAFGAWSETVIHDWCRPVVVGHPEIIRRAVDLWQTGLSVVEIESPVGGAVHDPAFGSAHGVYVNATVTDRHVYVPTFGVPEDAVALELLRARSDREIVPVAARNVADLGGSVRCLSGQFKGENARKLIAAARAR